MIDEKKLIKDLKDFVKDEGSLAIYGTKLKSIIHDCIIEVEGQPKIGEWIPCSEHMPDIEELVLLSLRSLDIYVGFRANTEGQFYVDGEGYVEYENVLAWQPLPEPYKS